MNICSVFYVICATLRWLCGGWVLIVGPIIDRVAATARGDKVMGTVDLCFRLGPGQGPSLIATRLPDSRIANVVGRGGSAVVHARRALEAFIGPRRRSQAHGVTCPLGGDAAVQPEKVLRTLWVHTHTWTWRVTGVGGPKLWKAFGPRDPGRARPQG